MYSAYLNRTTPFLAFLEGVVRSFDWGVILEIRKSRARRDSEAKESEDENWKERIVDWYIRDSIGAFESEESGRLAGDPMLSRRAFAVADAVLGPVPSREAILWYEQVVPGAGERIMERASKRLDHDGEVEIDLLKERIRQGYMGLAVGFIIAVLLSAAAMFFIYTDRSLAGFSFLGVYFGLVLAVSVYISKARVRRKFYTRDFFPRAGDRRKKRRR